ncbi:peptidoglycan hydrolase [Burkholderia thailandensis]|uniref:peptidoglycan hydrolase n=1 Tax=Burkholderia thailandensis TaxID=57975 RepID=UPI0002E6433D|nr:peptidoglycan hydrolase [Burkholderia thailandensis]AIP65723.1 peptidoglycan hydrolase [Burkholderia thailandensis]AOI53870.1 peptidoglycan hydrolase [Burkholderia thailandensis]
MSNGLIGAGAGAWTAAAGQAARMPGIAARPAADESDERKATYAAEQFEALLASQMLREMRNAIREISPEGSMFRDAIGSGLMDMMDGAIAQALATQRAFGIADFVLAQIAPAGAPAGAAAR